MHSSTGPAQPAQPAQPKRSKLVIVLAGSYGVFFLVMLWAAYNGQLPLGQLSKFHNFDKLGHLVLYCIPTYLGHRLLRHKHWQLQAISLPVFPSLFTLFTITEELIQGLSPNRTLDAGDMVCSLLGIAGGYWLAQRSKGK